jgi:hypothetical protein
MSNRPKRHKQSNCLCKPTITKTLKYHTTFLVEMAAIVWAMEHFDTYLRGRTFTVYSDHKPLEAHSKRHEKTLIRLQEA